MSSSRVSKARLASPKISFWAKALCMRSRKKAFILSAAGPFRRTSRSAGVSIAFGATNGTAALTTPASPRTAAPNRIFSIFMG